VEQVKDTQISDHPLPACTVSISPHVKSRESTAKIMWTVNACLLPPLILSVCIFGFQTLITTLVSVLSCVITEAVSQKLLHRPITIKDGSAVITGLLLADVIPPGVPLLLLGDIVVCPPVVGINAETSGHSFERELSLVILHGLLHLFGMDHDTEERKNHMWLLQELYWDKIEQSLPHKFKRDGESS